MYHDEYILCLIREMSTIYIVGESRSEYYDPNLIPKANSLYNR